MSAARTLLIGVIAALGPVAAGPLRAQNARPAETDSAQSEPGLATPGGAFARSLAIPGWGHAALGSYVRGGVYFGLQTASWFMLLKTMGKLGEARDIESRRVELARESILTAAEPALRAQYEENPALLAQAVDSTEAVLDSRNLISAREEQREDWIAWTVFWTLASGIDAYVSAQLSDFPARLVTEPRPSGGLRLGVAVPTRRWWR